jgi:hypothetical protein
MVLLFGAVAALSGTLPLMHERDGELLHLFGKN